MTQTLNNQVVLITGASRSIGRAIALELAHQGATVVGTATSKAGTQAITAYLAEAGVKGKGVVFNVDDTARGEAVIEETIKTHSGLSILVNNAGITQDDLTMCVGDGEWVSVIDMNLSAVFRLSHAVLRPMTKARGDRIINITSVVGPADNPDQTNYAAAKTGMGDISRALACKIGNRNITVNCTAPGFIDTDMTRVLSEEQHTALKAQIPLGYLSVPEDITDVVAFLTSPATGYITGSTLYVNGGMYMG